MLLISYYSCIILERSAVETWHHKVDGSSHTTNWVPCGLSHFCLPTVCAIFLSGVPVNPASSSAYTFSRYSHTSDYRLGSIQGVFSMETLLNCQFWWFLHDIPYLALLYCCCCCSTSSSSSSSSHLLTTRYKLFFYFTMILILLHPTDTWQ